MSEVIPFEKRSVSMPAVVAEGVRARVGSRGFSSYVVSAVTRQLERDALDEIIVEMEAKHGPADPAAVAKIMSQWEG